MKITETTSEDISQIFLDGRFDASTSESVERFIRERIDEGRHKFVLDMEEVPFIASAGLRVILVLARELRKEYDGDLRISSLQNNVSKVFEISGLNNVLHILKDVESAATSFAKDSK